MAGITALIMAAGTGTRAGSDIPKQFVDINGYPLIYYTLMAFQQSEADSIVIVTDKEHIRMCEDMELDYRISKISAVIEGGTERYYSVLNGLRYLKKHDKPGIVLVHDAARPYVETDIIDEIIEATQTYGAAIAAMPVKDTIKIASRDGFVVGTTDRETTWQAQTPQGFDFDLLYDAYEQIVGNLDENESYGGGHGYETIDDKINELNKSDKDSDMESDTESVTEAAEEPEGLDDEEFLYAMPKITDDAMVYQFAYQGKRIKLVKGGYENIKITSADELDCAECLLGE